MADSNAALASLIEKHESGIFEEWVKLQLNAANFRRDLIKEGELREHSRQFLKQFRQALLQSDGTEVEGSAWDEVRELLSSISRSRVAQGFTPAETAMFVFSFKQPLFPFIRADFATDTASVAELLWRLNLLIDQLGLYTTEVFQQSREQIIARQQQELLDLSTPVVSLHEGILALPLIGTLDSERTQVVMENLLNGIIAEEASIAIIDITGVPTVDTLVAQHLLKTVAAARLMGAECIISGIRPQIAQTIVHLGVELGSVVTKATLADAFQLALRKLNLTVVSTSTSRTPS